ncbi:MAG TPA: hypothetical protein VKE93_03740 [Candidatus Angelobacter sp.]|nr:hypothetical protein [Candidatus Angelobacter sp.]
MKKLTAFVIILALTSFAWAGSTASSRGTKALNPQPLPPGMKVELNPQPLPPRVNTNAVSKVAVNPQPLPPGQNVALNPQPFPPGPNGKSAMKTSSKGNLKPGMTVGFNPQPDPPGVQKHMDASSPKFY